MAETVFNKHDSKERVAYDLMHDIAGLDSEQKENFDKEYYLKLFCQCVQAANGYSYEKLK